MLNKISIRASLALAVCFSLFIISCNDGEKDVKTETIVAPIPDTTIKKDTIKITDTADTRPIKTP